MYRVTVEQGAGNYDTDFTELARLRVEDLSVMALVTAILQGSFTPHLPVLTAVPVDPEPVPAVQESPAAPVPLTEDNIPF